MVLINIGLRWKGWRIIGLVEGRRSENKTRTVQGKSIEKWNFIWEYYGGIRMVHECLPQLINHRSPSKTLTPHENPDQKFPARHQQTNQHDIPLI
jgi:hypothetical protein